jgi:hypothetical protein
LRVAGAFALKPGTYGRSAGWGRERRDRSVTRKRNLDGLPVLELGGRHVTPRLVQAAVVEPADVFDDGELELAAGAPEDLSDLLCEVGVTDAAREVRERHP